MKAGPCADAESDPQNAPILGIDIGSEVQLQSLRLKASLSKHSTCLASIMALRVAER
jgi:hypothetical protein